MDCRLRESATSDPGVATAAAADNTVTVDAVAPGTAFVTVTATDAGGLAGFGYGPLNIAGSTSGFSTKSLVTSTFQILPSALTCTRRPVKT